jgi:hypothetical protein
VWDLKRRGISGWVYKRGQILFWICDEFFEKVVVVFLGQVYTWGLNITASSGTPVLIDSLKAYRAVQVRFLIACF